MTVLRVVKRFHPAPAPASFTRVIDNPIRRRFVQRPEVVADRVGLRPGMVVVEIGPGKGSYTLAMAERVAPGGRVYAIDIQEDVVERLRRRAERGGHHESLPHRRRRLRPLLRGRVRRQSGRHRLTPRDPGAGQGPEGVPPDLEAGRAGLPI